MIFCFPRRLLGRRIARFSASTARNRQRPANRPYRPGGLLAISSDSGSCGSPSRGKPPGDYANTHADGRRVPLEIVGFWTPEYVAAKLKTLALFAGEPILLAVAESQSKSADGAAPIEWPPGTIFFKTALKVKEVLERLAACG